MNTKLLKPDHTQRPVGSFNRYRRPLPLASICAGATLCLAVSSAALARGPGGTGGETGTGNRIRGRATTPHSYQSLAGTLDRISSVSGQDT